MYIILIHYKLRCFLYILDIFLFKNTTIFLHHKGHRYVILKFNDFRHSQGTSVEGSFPCSNYAY